MHFKSLKLNNFRQYIGENKIIFCSDNNNVTLVFGVNGSGKTSIFRAIMFGLYGDRYLKQDKLTKEKERDGLVLVNEKLLEQNLNKKIEANVEIEFEDNNKSYLINRQIVGTKTEDKILQEPGSVSLIITENANTKPAITDHDEISNIINTIIDKKIRDFFLFDGEQMEELTKYSQDSRKEVQKGIRTLLQLDALEVAQNALKDCIKELDKQISLYSTDELAIVSDKLNKILERKAIDETKIENLTNNIKLAIDEEEQVRQKIDENKEALEKQKIRAEALKQINDFKNLIDKERINLKGFLEISGSYLGLPVLIELCTDLGLKINKGELPLGIRGEFIDKLLNDCMCICGNDLHDNYKAKQFLMNYKQQQNNGLSDAAMNIYLWSLEIKLRMENAQKDYDKSLEKYHEYSEQLEILKKKIEDLDEELKGIKPVQDLAERLEKIKIDKEQFEREQWKLEIGLDKLDEDIEDLKNKQIELSKNDKKVKSLINRRTILEKAIKQLIKINNEYSNELRSNIIKCATEIYQKIADYNSLQSLASITISDDFQLEVLSHSGAKMLSQISSGQRQIVSLAYICALLQVGSNLEMPLLMDTPFGRLSGAPRDACLKELPSILTQWIILVTDTEFQTEEASSLRSCGKWGCVYELENKDDRCSSIIEKDINNWQPKRTSR